MYNVRMLRKQWQSLPMKSSIYWLKCPLDRRSPSGRLLTAVLLQRPTKSLLPLDFATEF